MKKKTILIFVLLFILILFGCTNSNKTSVSSNNSSLINSKQEISSDMISKVTSSTFENIANESDINHLETSNIGVAQKDGWLYFCLNGEYSDSLESKNNKIIRINSKTKETEEIYKGNENFFSVELEGDNSVLANYIYPVYSEDNGYIKDYTYKSIIIDLNTKKSLPYDHAIYYNEKKATEFKNYKGETFFSINNEENEKYNYNIYKKDNNGAFKYLFSSDRSEIEVINDRIYYYDKTRIYSMDTNGNDIRLISNLSILISQLSINKNCALCFTDKGTILCNLESGKIVTLKNRYNSWSNIFYESYYYTLSTGFTDENLSEEITDIYKIRFDGTEEKIATQIGGGYRLYILNDYLYFYTGTNFDSPMNYNEHIYRVNINTKIVEKIV